MRPPRATPAATSSRWTTSFPPPRRRHQMQLPKLPPEAAQAVIGLISHALKLDGRASSAVQSLVAGLGDMAPDDATRQQIKSAAATARSEVQAAHDDFREAARGRPARA